MTFLQNIWKRCLWNSFRLLKRPDFLFMSLYQDFILAPSYTPEYFNVRFSTETIEAYSSRAIPHREHYRIFYWCWIHNPGFNHKYHCMLIAWANKEVASFLYIMQLVNRYRFVVMIELDKIWDVCIQKGLTKSCLLTRWKKKKIGLSVVRNLVLIQPLVRWFSPGWGNFRLYSLIMVCISYCNKNSFKPRFALFSSLYQSPVSRL